MSRRWPNGTSTGDPGPCLGWRGPARTLRVLSRDPIEFLYPTRPRLTGGSCSSVQGLPQRGFLQTPSRDGALACGHGWHHLLPARLSPASHCLCPGEPTRRAGLAADPPVCPLRGDRYGVPSYARRYRPKSRSLSATIRFPPAVNLSVSSTPQRSLPPSSMKAATSVMPVPSNSATRNPPEYQEKYARPASGPRPVATSWTVRSPLPMAKSLSICSAIANVSMRLVAPVVLLIEYSDT